VADYTRLIEFKVKDTDLNRAVNKLTKTLERIDKTLLGIDKKLDHIATKGFGLVAKEATKAERSVTKLGKAIKIMSNPQGLAQKATGSFFNFLGGKKGEIARRVAELYAFDGVLRKITNGSTGLPAFNRRVTEAATALTAFGLAHTNVVAAVVGGSAALLTGTKFFYDLGKGVRQAEASMIDFIKTSRQLGAGAGFRSLFPKGSLWGGDKRDTTPSFDGEKAAAAVEKELGRIYSGQRSPVTGFGSLGSLETRRKALAHTKQIQEKLVALTGKHLQASVQVKKSQFQYNLELAKTRLVQAAVTADIWAAQRAWQGVIGTLKSATGLLGGLLGGKFGGLGQAAGVIGTTRSIEFLIKQLDKVNIHFLDGVKNAATWASRVTEAVAGVSIAYGGLNSVLSAATWVTSAVKGFVDFERAAVTAFHNVEAARRRMERNKGSFQQNTLLQNLFGPLAQMIDGRMGDKLKEIYGGKDAGFGQEDQAFRGMSDRTPYGQRLTNELESARKKLSELRSTNEGFAKQVSRVLTLEARVNDELAKQKKIKEETLAVQNKLKEMDQRDPVAQKELENEKQLRAARAQRARENKQQLNTELKGIADRRSALEKLYQQQRKREKEQIAAIKQQERARAASRQKMARIGENLMLGAGFPLLFGGGAGAVGGGVLGAGLQAVSGSQGFGAQIFLSALGQQLDAFAGKVSQLGQALNSTDNDVSKLIPALGLIGSSYEKQVKLLEELGAKEEAFNLTRSKMIQLIGGQGVNALSEFGRDTKQLTDDWSRLMTQMGAGLAAMINSAGILKSIAESINRTVLLNQAIANTNNDPELSRLNAIVEKYSTGEIRPGGRMGRTGERHDYPSLAKLDELLIARQKILNADFKSLEIDNIRNLSFDAQIKKLNSQLELKQAVNEEERAAITARNQTEEIYNKFKEAGIVLSQEQKDKIKEIVGELNKIPPTQEKINDGWQKINQVVRDDIQEGIKGLIKGTATWADMLDNVADKFLDIALNQAFYGNMMGKAGKDGQMGGIFGALAGFGASIFGGSPRKAAGGPVTGGNSYVVGERGPELFVPRSGGNIVPNNAMGNVTVNVDASGSSAQGDGPSSEQLGQLIGAAIQNELIRQKRPGGLLG